MVQGIPIFKVTLSEGLFNQDADSDKLFAYAIEANKGPIGEPIFVASNDEAKRIFGVNFAPHFYQNGAGLILYRVKFQDAVAPSLTYKAYTKDYTEAELKNDELEKSTVDIIKITSTTAGTPKHKINLSRSITSANAYNLTVTIDGVGSKKYQNISSLTNVVKRINSKFAEYIKAELLVDEKAMLTVPDGKVLVKTADGYEVKSTAAAGDTVVSEGKFNPSRVFYEKDNQGKIIDTLSGGSNGKLLTTKGDVSTTEIPDNGLQVGMEGTGTGDNDANVDTTLLYAYRAAFEALEDINLLGVATLSNSEVVQNELVAHIEKLIDPEVAKYRFGVTGFLSYPGKDNQGRINPNTVVDVDTLTEATSHIDNPFIVFIGQGVVFEEDGVQYNLLPHEAVQLYTGIRSKLEYHQAIFGGANNKLLNGVKDVLPLTNDGADIYKEDRITLNEAGVMTFLKKYGVTFLQGVTTAQDDVVLSYESIMSIVVYVLRQLVDVAWPFMGETLTEDIKTGFINALSETLKNIMDTDNSLMALEDYNIAPYDVEIRAITTAGFNEAGKLVRENKLLAIVKIVPRGAIDVIELSVVVI
jgi:hypothetical protein